MTQFTLRGSVRYSALVTASITAAALATIALDLATNSSAAFASGQQSITWAPCTEDPTAECGTLAVPIDWKDPGGPKVDLALARRKATDPAHRIGSLVINPGGPGASGVDFAIGSKGYFSAEVTSHFDIVGFDPRGVARSHPIVCSTEVLYSSPSQGITSQAEFDAMANYNQILAADCRQRTGPLFDHVDTLSVVHDLDAIRAALGDRKLTYYGISYGTLIGQEYAEVYGNRARALMIDSNMDHALDTSGFLMTETAAGEDSFDQFTAWCSRTVACALHDQGAAVVYSELKAQAAAGTLILHGRIGDRLVDLPIDSSLLPQLIFGAFYGPAWWQLADILRDIYTGAVIELTESSSSASVQSTATISGSSGSNADLLTNLLRLGRNRTVYSAANPGSTSLFDNTSLVDTASTLPETTEYSAPVFCEDWKLPIRDYPEYARYQREMNRIAPDYGPSPLAVGMLINCLAWPGPVNNPQHELKVSSGPTIFMTNSMYDPATPYVWATHDARQLGDRAVLLTYEGWGHGVYGRSDCVTLPADAYLTSLKLPTRGTRCPAVEPSAPISSSSSSASALLGPSAGTGPLPSTAPNTLIHRVRAS